MYASLSVKIIKCIVTYNQQRVQSSALYPLHQSGADITGVHLPSAQVGLEHLGCMYAQPGVYPQRVSDWRKRVDRWGR